MDVLERLRAGGYPRSRWSRSKALPPMGRQTRALRQALSSRLSRCRTSISPGTFRDRSGFSPRSAPLRSMPAASRWRYGYMQPDDDDVDLGAPAIEIGVELDGAAAEPTDLPPGPDTDASAASPAMVEQKAVVEQTELPKAMPTETDDPDRLVTPNDTNKPKEDEPKVAVQCRPAPSIESSRRRGDRHAEHRNRSGGAALRRSRRRAPARARVASARPGKRSWRPISTRTSAIRPIARRRPPRSWSASSSTEPGTCCRAASSRDRAMHRSTRRRSPCCERADPVPPPPPLVADEGLTFTLPVIFQVKKEKSSFSA